MQKKKKKISEDSWSLARTKYHLSSRQIEMAKKLGMNPKKFGSLVPNKSEPWKKPLGQFIETCYYKRFKKQKTEPRKNEMKPKVLSTSTYYMKQGERKMEIPTLSDEEKQKLFTEMWLGSMMGPIGFIMRKLGPEALEELNEETAKGCAADLKERGVDDALKFAMNYGVVNKNIFGSDVEVEGNPEKAILDMKRCSNLEAALRFAEKGMPITKEQHCSGCINAYFKRVAENLGFKLDVEFSDKGCKMTISK